MDSLNGLVLTGEALLQQLQAAAESSISSANQKFTNQYELGAFLQNHVFTITPTEAPMGRLDILFEVLKAMNLDSPVTLNSKVSNWKKYESSDSSVAVAVMDHIFWHQPDEGSIDKPRIKEEAERLQTTFRIMVTALAVRDGLSPRGVRRVSPLNPSDFTRYILRISKEVQPKGFKGAVAREEIDKLWEWMKNNPDINIRVALGIAALEKPHLIKRLISPLDAEEGVGANDEKAKYTLEDFYFLEAAAAKGN